MKVARRSSAVVCGGVSLVLVFIIGAASPAFAQTDPLLGTWKLNPAKSKYHAWPAGEEPDDHVRGRAQRPEGHR